MTISSAALRVLYGLALALVPMAMMRKDRLRYGMATTALALVAYNFSGGVVPAAIAAVVLLGYQVYLRVVVRRLAWVVSTCTALGSYIAVRAALIPSQIGAWHESLKVRIFVGTIPVAVSMIVTCVEMKIRRVKDTIGADLREAAGRELKKAAARLRDR